MFHKLRPANQRPNRRGDTILSVMISVVIVGSVIGTTYHLIHSSLRLGRASQERGYAINAINTQIERLKAVLDLNPDRIFEDHLSLNVLATPSTGFGNKFCLVLDETASTGTSPSKPVIYIKVDTMNPPNDIHDDCQNTDEITFPVADAEPRVEVRYQKKHLTNINDNDRFEIIVYWTTIGSDREESLSAYYRAHPLLLGP